MPHNECRTCGAPLLNDPAHKHWKRCPKCEPEFAAWLAQYRAWEQSLAVQASVEANKNKGRPTQGGVKK